MTIKKAVSIALIVPAVLISMATTSVLAEEKTTIGGLAAVAQQAGAMAQSGSLGEMVNLNTASTDVLSAIPGIGPQLAEAITTYREAKGSFSQISELANVEGIDMSLVEALKPFLQL